MPQIALVGHVAHVTLGRVPVVPGEGEIAHLTNPVVFPGGGGGVAFHQLVRSSAEVLFFTAVGADETGDFIIERIAATGASIHAVRRAEAHTRDVVMVTPSGERTIIVIGRPLHPQIVDPLPWEALMRCDGAYFTAEDPAVLRACRAAKVLVATARRREAILAAGVTIDAILGSVHDPRESSRLKDYPIPPTALVMTEGKDGGWVETSDGITRFPAPSIGPIRGGTYGAGDSFAAAFTYHLALGRDPLSAATLAGLHGAAVLAGLNPLEHQRWIDSAENAASSASYGPTR